MNTPYIYPKILVYGYGNTGKSDDGLGNAFVQMLGPWLNSENLHHISRKNSLQLNAEDAYDISGFDVVVFVRASDNEMEDISFTKIIPAGSVEKNQTISPSVLLNICSELYGKIPESYLLQIKGFQWEKGTTISEKADENLWKAFHTLVHYIHQWIYSTEETA